MSNAGDQPQPTDSERFTFDLETITSFYDVRFPPLPSLPVPTFPFPIASVDIPLSAHQLSENFHESTFTTDTSDSIFVSDAVKIMAQQEFISSSISFLAMPEPNEEANLPGTSNGASTSSARSQLDETVLVAEGERHQGEDGTEDKADGEVHQGDDGTEDKADGEVHQGDDGTEDKAEGEGHQGDDGTEDKADGEVHQGDDGTEDKAEGEGHQGDDGTEDKADGEVHQGDDGTEDKAEGEGHQGDDGTEDKADGEVHQGEDGTEDKAEGEGHQGDDGIENKAEGEGYQGEYGIKDKAEGEGHQGDDGIENKAEGDGHQGEYGIKDKAEGEGHQGEDGTEDKAEGEGHQGEDGTKDKAEEVVLPSSSQPKENERLVNRVGPMPNTSSPLPPPEAEPRLLRPIPLRPLPLRAIRLEPNPRIRVLRVMLAEFATVPVQFAVEVMDLPADLTVTSTMINAIVRSPSRNAITCTIGPEFQVLKRGRMKLFRGTFGTTEETGEYKLQVRLVLPMTAYRAGYYGVLGDEINVVVMRNYLRDGYRFSGPIFQLPFRNQGRGRQEMSAKDELETTAGGRTVLKAWGLACDKPTNRLYYSDCMGNTVKCVNPRDGHVLFEFQGHSSFNHPMGIAVDEVNRRVLICDKDNHRICIFTVGGKFVSSQGEFGSENGMFNYPWDVAVNPAGNRFAVADTGNKRVQLFDLFGNFVNSFSIFAVDPFMARNQFDCPRGIVFGNQGRSVFVTDLTTRNVVQIPLHFRSLHRTAPECEFLQLEGLAFDEFNTLLVADSQHNCVCLMTSCGKLLARIRRVGENNLQKPVNVAIMAGGKIAVLDAEGKLYII